MTLTYGIWRMMNGQPVKCVTINAVGCSPGHALRNAMNGPQGFIYVPDTYLVAARDGHTNLHKHAGILRIESIAKPAMRIVPA